MAVRWTRCERGPRNAGDGGKRQEVAVRMHAAAWFNTPFVQWGKRDARPQHEGGSRSWDGTLGPRRSSAKPKWSSKAEETRPLSSRLSAGEAGKEHEYQLTSSSGSPPLNRPKHMARPRATNSLPPLNLPPFSSGRNSLVKRGDIEAIRA